MRSGSGFGSSGTGSSRGKMFPIKSHYTAEGGYHPGNLLTDNLDSVERGLMLVMELDIEVLAGMRTFTGLAILINFQ